MFAILLGIVAGFFCGLIYVLRRRGISFGAALMGACAALFTAAVLKMLQKIFLSRTRPRRWSSN
jgi:membrane associated rhomboid family serine protease